MPDLLGEEELKNKFTALRGSEPQLRLGDHISLDALREAVTEYQNLIRRELDIRKEDPHAF